jgi:NADPH-dependent 2,4-dienoyl-CoA reductase/sulfur reductase-like enzyme
MPSATAARSFTGSPGSGFICPSADIANKQGRVAGQNIGGKPAEFPGVVGAQSFKVFNLEVGPRAYGGRGRPARVQPCQHSDLGGARCPPMVQGQKIGIKLVADKATGKLLGGQVYRGKGCHSADLCPLGSPVVGTGH